MTARRKNPMPRAQIVRLGGLAVSADREHMARIGALGAAANIDRNGPDQPLRAALIRRGHDIASVAPSRQSSSATASRPKSNPRG